MASLVAGPTADKNDLHKWCTYFESTLLKKEIGQKSARMFIKWAELEEKAHGVQAAIQALEKGLSFDAEPVSALKEKLAFYRAFGVGRTVDVAEDIDDAQTMKIPTIELKKSLSSHKRKRVSFSSSNNPSVPNNENKENNSSVSTATKARKEDRRARILQPADSVAPVQISLAGSSEPPRRPDSRSASISQVLGFQNDNLIVLGDESFLPLKLLGKGGSSTVYRVISCKDGSLYALKRIEIRDNEDADEVFESYANEILLLKSLKGSSPYIIDLVASEARREQRQLTLLLEAGDVDLAKMLSQRAKSHAAEQSSSLLDPLFARMIWREMLLAVDHIHQHRIVHGDLKPANFVFVKGHLKLIDFGIAKCISADTTNIYRDSQVGTVNYMAPEAIAPTEYSEDGRDGQVMKLGKPSDIWSLGCILFQVLFTRPPFAALSTVQKLTAIPNPNHVIFYPEHLDTEAVEAARACLQRDPKQRKAIAGPGGLLDMAYLHPYRRDEPAARIPDADTPASPVPAVDSTSELLEAGNLVQTILSVVQKQALASHPGARQFIDQWFAGLDAPQIAAQIPALRSHAPRTPSSVSCEASVQTDVIADVYPDAECAIEATEEESIPIGLTNLSDRLGLPINMRDEIHQAQRRALVSVTSQEAEDRARRWMKADQPSPEMDMRSVLERRMGEMRRFMDLDQDNVTTTETIDITGFGHFR